MNRHAKLMQAKEKLHNLKFSLNTGEFEVTSGSSGNVYSGRILLEYPRVEATCSCDWCKYSRENGIGACSHILRAVEAMHLVEGERVHFWPDFETAHNQHRPIHLVHDPRGDVYYTTRKDY